MKNTGVPSEVEFDKAWQRLGKRAHVFKFVDSKAATGLNGRKTNTGNQPSDRLLTYEGRTIYAEIKSTIDELAFRFNLLRPTQGSYAAGVTAAGGTYDVFIHSLAYGRWYRVPYSVIRATKDAGRASLGWLELAPYTWSFPT